MRRLIRTLSLPSDIARLVADEHAPARRDMRPPFMYHMLHAAYPPARAHARARSRTRSLARLQLSPSIHHATPKSGHGDENRFVAENFIFLFFVDDLEAHYVLFLQQEDIFPKKKYSYIYIGIE